MKIRWVYPQVVIFQIMINLLRPVVIRVCFENNQIFKFGILAIIFLLLSLLLFQNINLTVWNCRYTQSTKKRRTRNQFTVNTIANFCCRKELTQKWSALLYPRYQFAHQSDHKMNSIWYFIRIWIDGEYLRIDWLIWCFWFNSGWCFDDRGAPTGPGIRRKDDSNCPLNRF